MKKKEPNAIIRRERELKCWSQRTLAELLDTTEQVVNRWESGQHKPNRHFQAQLCQLFGKSAEEFGFIDELQTTKKKDKTLEVPNISENIPVDPSLANFIRTDLTIHLIQIISEKRTPSCQELQRMQETLTQIIEEDIAMNMNTITRRDALRRIALLPLATFNFSALGMALPHPVEDILIQCSASIAACWELSKSGDEADLSLAFKIASSYIPTLKGLVKDSTSHRQAAASLVGQCSLLKTVLGWHLQGLKEAEQYAQEAVTYSKEAHDIPLLLSSLDYLAWVHYYNQRSKQALQTISGAIPLFKEHFTSLPSRLLGGIYSTLALMQAKNGQRGTPMIEKASEAFFKTTNEDKRIVYLDYTISDLILNDGMVNYQQGEYAKAVHSLTQLIDTNTLSSKMPLPERSRIEAINIMTLASLKGPKKDIEQIITLWKAGMQGAKRLQSEQRYSEALTAYNVMEGIWSNEKHIHDLRELSIHW